MIVAREGTELDSIISYSYPYLYDHEKISESIEKIKDYAEDSLPVLNEEKRIIGILWTGVAFIDTNIAYCIVR